jgi:hypothetical protein
VTSIFQSAMGAGFDRLHPRLAERFSVGLHTGLACVATGVMSRVWHGSGLTVPFLHLGVSRHILFPEQGRDIPFTVENWPYRDRLGRETITFNRTFELPGRRRRFDATMVFDHSTRRLVDYLGTHQHLAAELSFDPDGRGGLVIRSGEQRFRMHAVDVQVPAPLTGRAEVRERFDDGDGRFHIAVRVTNRWLGPLFGYHGSFTCRYLDIGQAPAPACAKPLVEEGRM